MFYHLFSSILGLIPETYSLAGGHDRKSTNRAPISKDSLWNLLGLVGVLGIRGPNA